MSSSNSIKNLITFYERTYSSPSKKTQDETDRSKLNRQYSTPIKRTAVDICTNETTTTTNLSSLILNSDSTSTTSTYSSKSSSSLSLNADSTSNDTNNNNSNQLNMNLVSNDLLNNYYEPVSSYLKRRETSYISANASSSSRKDNLIKQQSLQQQQQQTKQQETPINTTSVSSPINNSNNSFITKRKSSSFYVSKTSSSTTTSSSSSSPSSSVKNAEHNKFIHNGSSLNRNNTISNSTGLSSNVKRFDPKTIQKIVLEWCQRQTKSYQNVNITNFSSSWADGLAFCALIHSYIPDSFDFSKLSSQNRRYNFQLAFEVAHKRANITPLLEVNDMITMGNRPDDRCIYTYLSTIYSRFNNSKMRKLDDIKEIAKQ